MKKNSHVKIILREMAVDVRIGLHAHEQDRAQRVNINVELYADGKDYLRNVTQDTIIDYEPLYKGIKEWAEKPHVLLIETYINELMAICFQDQRVEAAQVSITKPDIFPEAAAAGVEVFMKREDWAG